MKSFIVYFVFQNLFHVFFKNLYILKNVEPYWCPLNLNENVTYILYCMLQKATFKT